MAFLCSLERSFSIIPLRAYAETTPSKAERTVELTKLPVIESTSTDQFAYELVDELHVKHAAIIKKLIRCESNGDSTDRPDSDGYLSRGILQYHDGANGEETWNDFSALSGIKGKPENMRDAILMTDWAISHNFISRWSCAYIVGIIK